MAPTSSITVSTLLAKLDSLRALADHLLKSMTSLEGDKAPKQTAPDSLKALSAPPNVLKAQTTKLGLLLINKPLTISAIYSILGDLESSVLPALVGNAACIFGRKDVWGRRFSTDIFNATKDALSSMHTLAEIIQDVAEGRMISKDETLLQVGKIFQVCDALIEISARGVVHTLARRVKSWMALVEDGLGELEGWGEDIAEDDDEDDEPEDESSDREDSLGEDFNFDIKKLPANRQDLIDLLAECLRRTRLIVLLFQALNKRRIRKFPFKQPPFQDGEEAVSVERMATVDKVLDVIELAHTDVDELAGAFYELNKTNARKYMDKLCHSASEAAELVRQSWDGRDDDLTTWLATWSRLIAEKKSANGTT